MLNKFKVFFKICVYRNLHNKKYFHKNLVGDLVLTDDVDKVDIQFRAS